MRPKVGEAEEKSTILFPPVFKIGEEGCSAVMSQKLLRMVGVGNGSFG